MAAFTDMVMMNFGGKQRTVECWESVISGAGLQIFGISRGKASSHSMGVLECIKKST